MMSRYFRDKEVIGWVIKESGSKNGLCLLLDCLMEDYEIIDCQYSTTIRNTYVSYSALVLIADKGDR